MPNWFHKKQSKIEEENIFYHTYTGVATYIAGNILRGVGNEEDIEECVNDALCQALLSMDKYDEKRGTVKTYVGIITRSVALAKRKQLLKHETVPFSEAFEITYEPDFELEYKELVQSIIKGLKEKEQELFTLHFLLQMPAEDIAKRLYITRGAVDTRLNRLRKKITWQLLADPFYQQKYGAKKEKSFLVSEENRAEEDKVIDFERKRQEGGMV